MDAMTRMISMIGTKVQIATLAVALGGALVVSSAYAQQATVNLEGPPTYAASVVGVDYRLHDFKALDGAGHPITDVPATLLDVMTGGGDWDAPKPDEVPAFTVAIPTAFRSQVALSYSAASGWVIVPRGWIVHGAAVGVDGTSGFTFVAPTGAKDGWMGRRTAPACMGCMYGGADGIIPGAHQRLVDLMTTGLADLKAPKSQEPEPRLVPTPDAMTHPNACTALLRYHVPSSPPVRAFVYLGRPGDGDLIMSNLYVALPDTKSTLADFVIRTFQKTYAVCRAGD
jgi:hypothetical protein